MVEERRLRVDFLTRAARLLQLDEQRVSIRCAKVERLPAEPFDIISARAFAPLDRLFKLGHSFSTAKTRWILPKGRNACSELDQAASTWQGNFSLQQSVTDEEACIIVAEGVSQKVGAGEKRGS